MPTPNSIYVYKLTTDNGGAPCVFNGMLSLALCKPQIRKMASKGDLIIGFGGKRLGQRPIYAAFVTEKPAPGAYYRLRRFARRPDCIYRSKKGRAVLKRSARFHTSGDNLKKDVGDTFENGYVLLSREFRYLGKAGTEKQLSKFPRVKRLLARLYQGHRLNHDDELRAELSRFTRTLWSRHFSRIERPSDDDDSLRCNTESRVRCLGQKRRDGL